MGRRAAVGGENRVDAIHQQGIHQQGNSSTTTTSDQPLPTHSKRQSPRLAHSPDLLTSQPPPAPAGDREESQHAQTVATAGPMEPRRRSPRHTAPSAATEAQADAPPIAQQDEEHEESLTTALSGLSLHNSPTSPEPTSSQDEVGQGEAPPTFKSNVAKPKLGLAQGTNGRDALAPPGTGPNTRATRGSRQSGRHLEMAILEGPRREKQNRGAAAAAAKEGGEGKRAIIAVPLPLPPPIVATTSRKIAKAAQALARLEPIQLDKTIRLSQPYIVLLCHQYPSGAVGIQPSPSAVGSHFRKQHKLRGMQLEQVLGFVASQAAEHTLNDPHIAELPSDYSLPIEGLPLLGGFSRAGWELATLQTFCRGRYARYWIVDDSSSSSSSENSNSSNSSSIAASTPQSQLTRQGHGTGRGAVLQMVQGCEAEIKREADERRRLAEDEAVKAIDRESRWARPMVLKAGQPPVSKAAEARLWSEEEAKANRRLRQLSASFARVIAICRKQLDKMPDDTLEWLASIDPAKPNSKPFGEKENPKTTDRYCLCFQHYLCYYIRIWALRHKKAKKKHKKLDIVAMAAKRDSKKMAEKKLKEKEDPDQKELNKTIFDFCIYSLKQKLGYKSYDNLLLHFTAILSINRTGEGWIPSHSHTRFLAGFLWCSQVLILKHFFKNNQYNSSKSSNSGDSSKSEGDGSVDNKLAAYKASFEAINLFQKSHRHWLTSSSYTPFSRIIK
ncbi:hypothetical protein BGZ61DRAFT_488006 [Ilyonectria robusta]|uniref:uncharacterized protein n=1 Tax=Ilyonectria robusta TaxID=1079257 RepID=UPI001E8D673A|nr:uncharacterized protein BGZ61DRAFT_488006 [Ilyonectria robusta]KAH8648879.1 hypothetical protein BGZ61DRAFT_488006 [Ilyonectria robusta]